ncbi:signal recognition particle-docking protein FtsY [Candidatus Woesearchaeota archaeon]|nr:signal recognition particle-docking protein FtsY [Candidatus Woesearchaeota archaeon]
MFKFLKEKLKKGIAAFSRDVEEKGEEILIEEDTVKKEPQEEKEPEKEGFFKKWIKKKQDREVNSEEEALESRKIWPEIQKEEKPAEREEQTEKEKSESWEEETAKQGFFDRIKEKVSTRKIKRQKFDEMFFELEIALLENNVAMEVIEKIKQDLKDGIVDKPIKKNKIKDTIIVSLKKSIEDILASQNIDIFERMRNKKPYVICFVGVNGSGKTTTIAKFAKMLLSRNKKVVMAASDTFRAAAIDQLQIHADNLGVKLIKHDYGSDPAAVAFDAVKYAGSRSVDAVLIDTAGRLHSNANLIDEMKKIVRVAKPDLKIFVGEAITGNDCIEQAVKFNDAIGFDGIILSKADIDEKGGASISVSYVTKKPVLYMGTGQDYNDIKSFDRDEIIKSLGLGD